MSEEQFDFSRNCSDFGNSLLLLKHRKKFYDTKLLIDDKEIFAHTIILAASCGFFFEHFEENENQKFELKTMRFQNYDKEHFEKVINYCYTGNIKTSVENVIEILKIANLLIIKPILEKASEFLAKTLTITNCLSTWKLAESEQLEDLKIAAFEFIKRNFEEVSRSQDFLTLEYLELKAVVESKISVSSETSIYLAVKKWITHDETSRRDYLIELLDLVKLSCLPRNFLISEPLELCESSVECFSKFINAVQSEKTVDPNDCEKSNCLLAIGGHDTEVSKIIEVYDVFGKKWIDVDDIKSNRINFAVCLIDDELMLIGGKLNSSAVNTVESYNILDGKVKTLSNMKHARRRTSAVHFRKNIYVIGGYNEKCLASVERWSSETKEWMEVASLTSPRNGCGVNVMEEEIFVVGGFGGAEEDQFLTTTEAYDPIKNEWRKCAEMNEKREAPGVAVVGGYLYAVGGWNDFNVYSKTVEKYDLNIDKWTQIKSMNIERYWLGTGNLRGNLVVAGGKFKGEKLSSAEVYDEVKDEWNSLASLNHGRWEFYLVEVSWTQAKHIMSRKKIN